MGVRRPLAGVALGAARLGSWLRAADGSMGELAAVLLLTRAGGWRHPATGRHLAEMVARRTGLSVAQAADALRERLLLGADGGTALVEVAMSRGLTLREATAWAQDPASWRP